MEKIVQYEYANIKDKILFINALNIILRKKGKSYAPTSYEIQLEINKLQKNENV